MRLKPSVRVIVGCLAVLSLAASGASPAPGTRLSFRVLSTQTEAAPPFAAVDFIYGPKEPGGHANGGAPTDGLWWQLEIRTNAEVATIPLCTVRGLTSTDPLAGQGKPRFARYQLRIPGTGEAPEYVDIHSSAALLPPWVDFEKHFTPSPAPASHRQGGAPETCELLGQVLSLHHIGQDAAWAAWSDVKS